MYIRGIKTTIILVAIQIIFTCNFLRWQVLQDLVSLAELNLALKYDLVIIQ